MKGMAICQNCCTGETKVVDTRILRNGVRRRRYSCRICNFRWSAWSGEPPAKGRVAGSRPGLKTKPPLTEDQVRLILTSPLSSGKLAKELGRPTETVAGVRRGAFHKNTLPDMPRRKPVSRAPHKQDLLESESSCMLCKHWDSSKCQMGFPDAVEEGPAFAAECSVYEISASSKLS